MSAADALELSTRAREHLASVVDLLGSVGITAATRMGGKRRGTWDRWIREALAPRADRAPEVLEAARQWKAAMSLWWQLALTDTADIVRAEARRYYAVARGRFELDDLAQAGRYGLFVAAQRWRVEGGAAWRGFAANGVRQAIRRALREGSAHVIHVSEHARVQAVHVQQDLQHLTNRGLPATVADSARRLGVRPELAEAAILAQRPVELDALVESPNGESEFVLVAEGQPADELADRQRQIQRIESVLARLPDRQAAVMRGHLEGRTNTDIGVGLGLSRERIRQIKEEAMATVREKLGVAS